jgi:hypothetical protein
MGALGETKATCLAERAYMAWHAVLASFTWRASALQDLPCVGRYLLYDCGKVCEAEHVRNERVLYVAACEGSHAVEVTVGLMWEVSSLPDTTTCGTSGLSSTP